jgi:hypothetical protein
MWHACDLPVESAIFVLSITRLFLIQAVGVTQAKCALRDRTLLQVALALRIALERLAKTIHTGEQPSWLLTISEDRYTDLRISGSIVNHVRHVILFFVSNSTRSIEIGCQIFLRAWLGWIENHGRAGLRNTSCEKFAVMWHVIIRISCVEAWTLHQILGIPPLSRCISEGSAPNSILDKYSSIDIVVIPTWFKIWIPEQKCEPAEIEGPSKHISQNPEPVESRISMKAVFCHKIGDGWQNVELAIGKIAGSSRRSRNWFHEVLESKALTVLIADRSLRRNFRHKSPFGEPRQKSAWIEASIAQTISPISVSTARPWNCGCERESLDSSRHLHVLESQTHGWLFERVPSIISLRYLNR